MRHKLLLLCAGVILLAFSARTYLWQLYLSPQMMDAVHKGDTVTVQALLRRGANPNRLGAGGLLGGTPLMWATERGDLKMMKVLVQGGANPNVQEDLGYTALMGAPSPQTAQFLLDAGANPRLRNGNGLTAWQCMKYAGHPQIAAVIIRAETKLRSPTSQESANRKLTTSLKPR